MSGVVSNAGIQPRLYRSERDDFESAVGSLQWLSGNARPETSALVSLIQRIDLDLFNDLRQAMKHA
eukprot:4414974-Pyramimonas_sp.AAC.1